MRLTDELKIVVDKIRVKQLKYLHYHLKNWISMNIGLVKMQDINQEYLNKPNLNILH